MSDIGKTQNSAEGTLVQTTGKNERFHIALLCLFARQSSTSRTKVTSRAKFSARLCLCTCSCRPRCCRLYCRYTVSGARKTSKHSLNCGLSVSSLRSFVLGFLYVCFISWHRFAIIVFLVTCIPNEVCNHNNINCK